MDGERDQSTQGAVLLSRCRLSCILGFWHGDDGAGVPSADEAGGSDGQARFMVEWGPEVFTHKEMSEGEEKGDDDDAEEGKRERRSFDESVEG